MSIYQKVFSEIEMCPMKKHLKKLNLNFLAPKPHLINRQTRLKRLFSPKLADNPARTGEERTDLVVSQQDNDNDDSNRKKCFVEGCTCRGAALKSNNAIRC